MHSFTYILPYMKDGCCCKRKAWEDRYVCRARLIVNSCDAECSRYEKDQLIVIFTDGITGCQFYEADSDDLLATDWQLVEHQLDGTWKVFRDWNDEEDD